MVLMVMGLGRVGDKLVRVGGGHGFELRWLCCDTSARPTIGLSRPDGVPGLGLDWMAGPPPVIASAAYLSHLVFVAVWCRRANAFLQVHGRSDDSGQQDTTLPSSFS